PFLHHPHSSDYLRRKDDRQHVDGETLSIVRASTQSAQTTVQAEDGTRGRFRAQLRAPHRSRQVAHGVTVRAKETRSHRPIPSDFARHPGAAPMRGSVLRTFLLVLLLFLFPFLFPLFGLPLLVALVNLFAAHLARGDVGRLGRWR